LDQVPFQVAALEDKQTAAILGTEKQIENIQFETSIMGLSNDERQKAIALRMLETSGVDKQSTAYETLKGRLTEALAQQAEQHAALEASRLAATNQVGAWNDLASVVIDTFRRGKCLDRSFLRLQAQARPALLLSANTAVCNSFHSRCASHVVLIQPFPFGLPGSPHSSQTLKLAASAASIAS
jgi:hypothetical protein